MATLPHLQLAVVGVAELHVDRVAELCRLQRRRLEALLRGVGQSPSHQAAGDPPPPPLRQHRDEGDLAIAAVGERRGTCHRLLVDRAQVDAEGGEVSPHHRELAGREAIGDLIQARDQLVVGLLADLELGVGLRRPQVSDRHGHRPWGGVKVVARFLQRLGDGDVGLGHPHRPGLDARFGVDPVQLAN